MLLRDAMVLREPALEVSSNGLGVSGEPCERAFSLTEAQVGQAKIVALHKEPKYRHWFKTNGTGLPRLQRSTDESLSEP